MTCAFSTLTSHCTTENAPSTAAMCLKGKHEYVRQAQLHQTAPGQGVLDLRLSYFDKPLHHQECALYSSDVPVKRKQMQQTAPGQGAFAFISWSANKPPKLHLHSNVRTQKQSAVWSSQQRRPASVHAALEPASLDYFDKPILHGERALFTAQKREWLVCKLPEFADLLHAKLGMQHNIRDAGY